jgi:hypothetical protein
MQTYKSAIAATAEHEQSQLSDQVTLEEARWARIADLMDVGPAGVRAQEEHAQKVRNLEVARLSQQEIVTLAQSDAFLAVPSLPSCDWGKQGCARVLAHYASGLRSLISQQESIGRHVLGKHGGFDEIMSAYRTFVSDLEKAAADAAKLEAELCASGALKPESCKASSQDTTSPKPEPTSEEPAERGMLTSPKTFFKHPELPTAIEQTYCHMGSCTWARVTAATDVFARGDEVLRKAVFQATSTETADEEDYPTKLPPGEHHWTASTVYFLCSLTRPTEVAWDSEKQSWLVTQLRVVDPYGFQSEAVADYKRVCHGIKAGTPEYEHPDQIGYVDRDDATQQTHVKRPVDVLR